MLDSSYIDHDTQRHQCFFEAGANQSPEPYSLKACSVFCSGGGSTEATGSEIEEPRKIAECLVGGPNKTAECAV